MTSWEKYEAKASSWTEREYADARAYLAHRAELVRTLGPELSSGDIVLDLACGDGGLGDFLPGQRYVGVDASEAMVAAGRQRGREIVLADLNDYAPPAPVHATTIFRAIYYARDRRALLQHVAGYTRDEARLRPQPAPVRARGCHRRPASRRLRPGRHEALLRPPDPRAAAPPGARAERRPLARLLLRFRFTLLVAASRRAAAS